MKPINLDQQRKQLKSQGVDHGSMLAIPNQATGRRQKTGVPGSRNHRRNLTIETLETSKSTF